MHILVTGAGGLLGGALARLGATGLAYSELDVTDPEASTRALAAHRPDAVVFCSAISQVDRCATDPRAREVNVEAPAWWAARVPLWLVSTNYVFSGPGPHLPTDVPHPVGPYGLQKAEAERRVLAAGGCVVRTGWLFGAGGRNFGSRLGRALRAGPVDAIADWPVQPTWVDDLARFLLTLPQGVQHAIGSEETTWAEVAQTVANRLGVPSHVRPRPLAALELGPRPPDARLAPAQLPGWSNHLDVLVG